MMEPVAVCLRRAERILQRWLADVDRASETRLLVDDVDVDQVDAAVRRNRETNERIAGRVLDDLRRDLLANALPYPWESDQTRPVGGGGRRDAE